jgi:hypothetical protein
VEDDLLVQAVAKYSMSAVFNRDWHKAASEMLGACRNSAESATVALIFWRV